MSFPKLIYFAHFLSKNQFLQDNDPIDQFSPAICQFWFGVGHYFESKETTPPEPSQPHFSLPI